MSSLDYHSPDRPPIPSLTIVALTLSALVFVTALFTSLWIVIDGPMPPWAQYLQPVICFGPMVSGGLAVIASFKHFTAKVRSRGTWMVWASLFFGCSSWPLIMLGIVLHK